MSRRLSGEASPEEVEELQDLLERSPDKQYLIDILHSYFAVPFSDITGPETIDLDLEQKFRRIVAGQPAKETAGETDQPGSAQHGRSSPQRPSASVFDLPVRKMIGYAAAIGGVLLLTWGIYRVRPHGITPDRGQPARGGEVIARPGARTRLVLPDGTQVWLNSNSKLKYSEDFNVHSREVGLEGEAYFDVVKDAQRLFIVHAAAIDIKVLGTAFTVKSYPQDATIEATLLKGAIEIYRKDNPNTPRVILKANEKFVFNKHLPETTPADHALHAPSVPPPPDISINPIRANVPDSEKVETAWLYNRLVFNGDSFKELAEKMERWYNVTIIFEDEELNKYRFGGAFVNETVEQALNALQLTANFTYKIKGNEIELYGK